MKGQLSLEFMLIFAATIILIAALCMALDAGAAAARIKSAEMDRARLAESAARSAESRLNDGLPLGNETPGRRIENGRFYVPAEGRLIEIGGVFVYGDEPV